MFNFFSSVVEFFSVVWNFISNIISSTITAFSVIYSSLVIPQALRGFVPAFIGASIFIVSGIGIIKLILGWGNN